MADEASLEELARFAMASLDDLVEGRPGADVRRVIAALDALAPYVGDDPERQMSFEALRLVVKLLRAREDRDFASLVSVPERIDELRDRAGPGSPLADALQPVATVARLMALDATAPTADLVQVLPRLLDMQDGRAGFMDVIPPMYDALNDRPVREQDLHEMRRRALSGKLSPVEQAFLFGQLGFINANRAFDYPGLLNIAIFDLRRAAKASPLGDSHRPFVLSMLGETLLRRAEVVAGAPSRLGRMLLRLSLRPRAGARADIAEAVTVLEEALETAGWPGHAFWSQAALTLAQAYRVAGRAADGRAMGLRSLRGHAWRVLLQPDTAARQAAVRFAAVNAMTVAGWHIEDGDAAGAAVALDACRGLILHSATEYNDVPTQLAAVGADDLAEQWRAHPGPLDEIPVDLRRAALQRLTADGRLLDPPAEGEVRAALAEVGADALVYLVPPEPGPPAAVILPTEGPATILPLPGLSAPPPEPFRSREPAASRESTSPAEPETPVAPASAAQAAPAASPQTAAAPTRELPSVVRPPDRLGALCDWAWEAAIGPLLDAIDGLDRHNPGDTGDRQNGGGARPPRLVLIPMGDLSTVPWHAARHTVDGRREYAVERAVFSYTASARMLCRIAGRPVPGQTEAALVVGDPDTAGMAQPLPAAREEALAVARCYRDALYVGQLADDTPSPAGTGTPEEVLDWLADGSAGPGGVLHLACHGVAVDGVGPQETSYLLLAGGQRLAAERLVAAMSDHSARLPSLVVLAACSSGVSGRGQDEAFSLSTTFLASGAGSVVAAHWSLPDRPTSDLMLLFHRHLKADGLPPADALRAAQLALLDRNVADWAGIVHYGR